MAELPWGEISEEEVMPTIQKRSKLPCPLLCPSPVYDVMYGCWLLDSSLRWTAAKIRDAFDDLVAAQGIAGYDALEWPVIGDAKRQEGVKVSALDVHSEQCQLRFSQLETSFDQLVIGDQLGKGNFGTVDRATLRPRNADDEEVHVAVKRLFGVVPEIEAKQFEYEARLLVCGH